MEKNSRGCICKQNFHSPAINTRAIWNDIHQLPFPTLSNPRAYSSIRHFFVLSQSSTVKFLKETSSTHFYRRSGLFYLKIACYGVLQTSTVFPHFIYISGTGKRHIPELLELPVSRCVAYCMTQRQSDELSYEVQGC